MPQILFIFHKCKLQSYECFPQTLTHHHHCWHRVRSVGKENLLLVSTLYHRSQNKIWTWTWRRWWYSLWEFSHYLKQIIIIRPLKFCKASTTLSLDLLCWPNFCSLNLGPSLICFSFHFKFLNSRYHLTGFLFYYRGRYFNWKEAKFFCAAHFHQKMRATRGLVPNSQLPCWCYIEPEGLICEDSLWNNCKKRLENPCKF